MQTRRALVLTSVLFASKHRFALLLVTLICRLSGGRNPSPSQLRNWWSMSRVPCWLESSSPVRIWRREFQRLCRLTRNETTVSS